MEAEEVVSDDGASKKPRVKLMIGVSLIVIVGFTLVAMLIPPSFPRDRYAFLKGANPINSFREFGGSVTFVGRVYTWEAKVSDVETQVDRDVVGVGRVIKQTAKAGSGPLDRYIWNLPGARQIQASPMRGREIHEDWVTVMIVDSVNPSLLDRAKYWLQTHSPF